MMMLFCTHGWSLIRSGGAFPEPPRTDDSRSRQRCIERHLVFWTAIGFAAAKIELVILVEPAIDRYMEGAAVLLPCIVAVWVADLTEQTFPAVAYAFTR